MEKNSEFKIVKWIKEWIKKKLEISELQDSIITAYSQFDKQIEQQNKEIALYKKYFDLSLSELQEFTRVDADVGMRGNNTIILTGVFKNKAYVRFYDIGNGEFKYLVEQLQSMKKYALIRNVDAPSSFKGTFNL